MSTTAASPHTTDSPSIPIFTSKRRKIFRRRERSESPPATSTITTTSETAPTTSAASLKDSSPSPSPIKPTVIRRPVRRFGLEASSQANGSHLEGSTSTSNPDAGTGANALASSADSDAQAVINRFTHQTGQILDVDKHMMAYIESRMSSSSVTPRPPPSQQQQQQQQLPQLPQQPSDSKPISVSTTQSSPQSSSHSAYPQNSESRGATLGKLHEVDLGEDARRRNILRTTAALSSTTSTNPSSSTAAATASTAATSKPSQDRTPHPLTLIAPSPPITAATLSTASPQPPNRTRQKKLKRTLADTERDLLVEQVLAEYSTAHPNSTAEQSDPWDLNQNGEDADMAADDRIAEKFRKEFVDAMLSKRRRRGDGAGSQSAQKKKGEEKRPKGPKLGGSRMARQMMREREMGKK